MFWRENALKRPRLGIQLNDSNSIDEMGKKTVTTLRTWFAVVALAGAHGAVDFYVTLLQALAPGMALRLGVPLGKVVVLVGVVQMVCNGIQPVVGWLMGMRNLSWILWAGSALSIAPCFMGWVDGYWALVVLVVVGALGTGIFHPEGVLSAHDSSGNLAYLGVPLFMAGGYFFSAASAPAAIHWVDWFDFPALAWLTLPGLVFAAGLLLIHRRKRRQHPSLVIRPRSRRQTRMETGRFSAWVLLALAAFCNCATALFMAILTSHYELVYGPEARAWAGWVLLVIGGGGVLASFFWGRLCRGGNYYLVVFLTQLGSAPLFALLAYASSPRIAFLISLPLSVISPGAVYPAAVTLIRNAAGLTQSLRVGLIVGGTWGTAGLVVMVAGHLLDRGVDSSHLIVVSACCCLIASLYAGLQALITRRRGATA